MKFNFLITFTLILLSVAQARENEVIDRGLNRSVASEDAQRVCSGRMSDRQRRKCHREVERGGYYDSNALTLCRTILDYSPKLHCIRTIRDHSFDRGVTGFCNMMLSNGNKIQCLNIAKNKTFDLNTDGIGRCRRQPVGFFTQDANRLHCLRELPFERAP